MKEKKAFRVVIEKRTPKTIFVKAENLTQAKKKAWNIYSNTSIKQGQYNIYTDEL